MFDKYTFPMAMTDLKTKLADAERDVTTSEKRCASTLGQKDVSVQQIEKRLKVQKKQLEEREEDLENTTMTAPCPGIVVYGDPNEPWYRDRIKVGGQVFRNFCVMTIPDLRVMQVKLQIHEADISKLKLGLSATISADSYPGLSMKGEVTKIATVASGENNWGGSSEVKRFDVEVTIDSKDIELRPGISAKVEIDVERVPDALFVPIQSVFAEDGAQYCHVQRQGEPPTRRRVEVGKSNDVYVQVTNGLAAGERVLLYNPMLPGTRTTDGEPAAEPGDAPAAEGTPAEASSAEASSAKAGS
jgi:HlyD family secretion protein